MQLNSKVTHEILLIREFNNGIIFDIFENDLKLKSKAEYVPFVLDKNQPTGTATIAEFELQKAYEHLASLPEFADYEISEAKNWKFADEIIRLIVDKNKLTPHLLAADAVGQLVSYVLSDPKIKQKTIDTLDGFIYIYLKFIRNEPAPFNHKEIIENSDCIVIDNYNLEAILTGTINEI